MLVEGRDIGVIDTIIWKEAAELMLEYGTVESLPDDLDSTLPTEFYKGPIKFEDCSAGSKLHVQVLVFPVVVGMVLSMF